MKKLILILPALALTLGLSAQNTRTRSPRAVHETTTSPTEEKKKAEPVRKASPAVIPSTSSSGRTRSVSQPTNDRSTSRSANSSGTRTRQTSTVQNKRGTSSAGTPAAIPTRPNSNTRTRNSEGTSSGRKVGTSSTVNENRQVHQGETRNATGSDSRRTATTTSGRTSNREINSGTTYSGNRGSNHYDPKVGQTYTEKRKVYITPAPRRIARPAPVVNYVYRPVEYRRIHYPYSAPSRINIIWTNNMYREYVYLYPEFNLWYYPYGYHIENVSAYDASAFIGEVANIYGRVYDTWYLRETDEYFLYFGGPYPYQDFSIVLTGKDARRFSRNPERFFTNRNISVTGLVSLWEDKPEIVVKKRSQIHLY